MYFWVLLHWSFLQAWLFRQTPLFITAIIVTIITRGRF
jgi:hypothetical protein